MNLDWSHDGQYIASASIDGVVRLWSSQKYINSGLVKLDLLNLILINILLII